MKVTFVKTDESEVVFNDVTELKAVATARGDLAIRVLMSGGVSFVVEDVQGFDVLN